MTAAHHESAFCEKRVVVGVCGGIAAYKAVELCRRLADLGAVVTVVLTESATRFVGPITFEAVTHEPVRTSLWDAPEPNPHIVLGQQADVVVIAPATATHVASFAHGLGDDLLSLVVLAARCPIVVAPAMHAEMWSHPATVRNVAQLSADGVTIVSPEVGHLAGGDVGVGRLAALETIVNAAARHVNPETLPLVGKRVLVTSGGTREPIDPVRFIGNRSSGKQGNAIALAACNAGAEVVLVAAGEVPDPHPGLTVIRVERAVEMHEAVLHELRDVDVVVMAAAVADYQPAATTAQKWKKADGPPRVELVPTVDILGEISSQRRRDQCIVGFAAETEHGEEHARAKLKTKKLDLIVLNDVTETGAGFEIGTNHAMIYDQSGKVLDTGVVAKSKVAEHLVSLIVAHLEHTSQHPKDTP